MNDNVRDELVKSIENLYSSVGENGYFICKLYEEKILKINDLDLSYWFAKNIYGADIKAHGMVVLDSKDPEWNFKFACLVKDADIKAHAQVVLDSKDLKWNCNFAEYVKDADINAHEQIIIESNDIKLYYNFLREVKHMDLNGIYCNYIGEQADKVDSILKKIK